MTDTPQDPPVTPRMPVTRGVQKTRTPGIYKRGNVYAYRFRDVDGKVRQRGARTMAEARRMRAEATAEVARIKTLRSLGEYIPAAVRTGFQEYVEEWGKTYSGRTSRGLREITRTEYVEDLKRACAYFGDRPLGSITPRDVRAYGRHLYESGLQPATVRRLVAPLRLVLASAFEDDLIRSNPAAGVRLSFGATPAAVKSDDDVKALTGPQLAALVEAVDTPAPRTRTDKRGKVESVAGRRLLVTFLAETGLRISEGLAMTWENVDLVGRRVRVVQRVRGGELDSPKSARGRREVPIGQALAAELAAHRDASSWAADTDYVFASTAGTPWDTSNAHRWLRRAATAAGIPWGGFHSLRHTAASRWLLSGVSIATVSRLLGHADAAFTLRTYISVLPDDLPDGDTLAAAVSVPR